MLNSKESLVVLPGWTARSNLGGLSSYHNYQVLNLDVGSLPATVKVSVNYAGEHPVIGCNQRI